MNDLFALLKISDFFDLRDELCREFDIGYAEAGDYINIHLGFKSYSPTYNIHKRNIVIKILCKYKFTNAVLKYNIKFAHFNEKHSLK